MTVASGVTLRSQHWGRQTWSAEPVTVGGFENHFHNLLFDLQVKTSVTCTSCHPAHLETFPELQFLDRNKVVLPACERCHQELGRGPAKGLQ
jgi:cytochrome c553